MLIRTKFDGAWLQDNIRLYPGGGKGSTPAPDPRLVEAQIRSQGVQDDAIQRILANSERLQPLQEEGMRFGLETSRTAYAQAQEDRQFALGRRGKLTGLQDRMVSDAAGFNTEDRRDQLAAEAVGDVRQAFSAARGSQMRGLQRMGVNPNDGRYASMNQQFSAQEALAQANASNKVRQAARMEGYSLTDRATNALAGYPALGMQATAAGAGYGGLGLNVANQGLAGQNSGYGTVGQLAGQAGQNATSAYGTQANSYNQGQGNQGEATGAILGTAATVAAAFAFSDRRLKRDIVRIGTTKGGHAWYSFRYVWDDATSYGVMADEVANIPGAVASAGGFSMVDYACLQ